jgi:hypothetical protein
MQRMMAEGARERLPAKRFLILDGRWNVGQFYTRVAKAECLRRSGEAMSVKRPR